MGALAVLPAPNFADSIHDLVERVDYRRADTPEEREEIYRLRYDAYRQEGAIEPNIVAKLFGQISTTSRTPIFSASITTANWRALSGSTSRLPECPELPALGVFRDVLTRTSRPARRSSIRRASSSSPRIARTLPKISYATVRIGWMACEFFETDWVLATVRVEHQAFYKRLFGHKPLCKAAIIPP